MYNTRKRSELLDSLDYLIPPVKKHPRAIYNDFLYNDVKLSNQERLVRDCNRTIFANPFGSKTSVSDVQTCSSLILKKTTKQLIHEQYSILNLSTCNRGSDYYIQNKNEQRKEKKPLIKVTVIPNAKQTQTSTVFNRRCRYSKIVQSTVSNQENFIKNRNVYLLTNCNKREKIHELKTSESAKLSNQNIYHKYGDISFKHITEPKQIINFLNMDKRKRKDNKNKKAVRTNISNDCEPPKDKYSDKCSSPNDRKSRVTVVGQIGLNQDDRYVLKYAATVNDKPIETNCVDDDVNPSRLTKNYNFRRSSQYRTIGCNVNNCETFRQFRQQNSDVQTDIANPYYLPGTTHNNRGASQSTQVNFNFSNSQSIKKFRNQTAQCDCNRATISNPLDSDTEDKLLKKCKSPLVVISVYPRQVKGSDENDAVKIIQRQTSPERNEVTNIIRSNITQENTKQFSPGKLSTTNKMEAKLFRSRSPSPKTKIGSKKNSENKTNSRGRNNNSVKKGGPNQTASHKYYIINSLEDNTSCHCCDSKFLQTADFKRQENNIKTNKSKDTEDVKKALVNSFLRNVNIMDKDNKKIKLFQPKDDASKVTINIDGDNDHYDVLLEQSHYDTDVSIKRITKPRPSEIFSSEEEMNTKSLENFLLVSNERRKNECKQDRERIQPPGVLKIIPTGSRLNIKDSIEIFRRQGEHANYVLKPHSKNDKNDFVDSAHNSDSYAPVKHYRGDSCSLSDPNERDREIRQLLGIKKYNRLQKTDHTDDRPTTKVSCCCCKKCSRDTSCTKCFQNKYLKCKSPDTKHEITQMGTSEPHEKSPDITDSNQEHEKKSKISRKSINTQKTEHEHVFEHPDLKTTEEETSETHEPTTEDSCKEPIRGKSKKATHCKNISKKEKNFPKTVSKKQQCAKETPDPTVHMENNTMPSNLILNRNVQIFLQVEKFNKERPIVLTRTQYDKVKRIIDSTISKKLSREKRKRCSLKSCNVVSIGEIKAKQKLKLPLSFNREIQTDRPKIFKKTGYITDKHKDNNIDADDTKHKINKKIDKQTATESMAIERHNIEKVHPREAVSSMEIRYASVEYEKRVMISSSSTRVKNDIIQTHQKRNDERMSNSIHTIFKGRKKSATPNLGTSACSVYSHVSDFSTKSYKQPKCAGDFKPKKPFLQRLISCLVMRSTQTSNIKDAVQKRHLPSVRSSLDSYHISTSLGALEMSSSLYDTSASFYSNHTTMPVNKIKRGFFSSVRGFLTSRRS